MATHTQNNKQLNLQKIPTLVEIRKSPNDTNASDSASIFTGARGGAIGIFNMLKSLGDSEQVGYGYASEFQGDYTELVYLRSRFLSPETGRFLTKDTWRGDYKRPDSLNKWNFVEGNPINRTDPSGFCYIDDQNNKCIPYEPGPPNITNYNEKSAPVGINWISNPIGNNINIKLAPIYGANGKLITNTNAAQFEIDGYPVTPSDKCKVWADKNHKECKAFYSQNVNFCGQVVLSAILGQLIPGLTARTIVDQLHPQDGTGATALADILNNNYGSYVLAESFAMSSNAKSGAKFFAYMSSMFTGRSETLLATIVNIRSGNGGIDESGLNGKLGTKGGINHWILITGVSTQWRNSNDESPYNWVRIFNPFDNQTEYYWWPDFQAAWKVPSNSYISLKISMQSQRP